MADEVLPIRVWRVKVQHLRQPQVCVNQHITFAGLCQWRKPY